MTEQDVLDILNRDLNHKTELMNSASAAGNYCEVDALQDKILETKRTLKKIQAVIF